MPGPWEKYAAPVEAGPWTKYATPSIDPQRAMQEHANSLDYKMAVAQGKEAETLPEYAGNVLKTGLLPSVGIAIGTVGGLPGQMTGAALGETANQALEIGHRRSVIPEADKPDLGKVALVGASPLIAKGVTKGAEKVGQFGKWLGTQLVPEKFANKWLKESIGDKAIPKVAQALADQSESIPGYPATAAEKVAHLPEGTVIQSHQKIVAKTPGGISSDFGQRLLDQRASIQGARQARDVVTDPMREQALSRANFGHELPKIDRMIADKNRLIATPPAPTPDTSGALKSAVELHAPYQSPALKSGTEKVTEALSKEISGKAAADKQALVSLKGIIEQQGFKPLKSSSVVANIDKTLSNPEIRANSLAEKILGRVKERLVELSDANGAIDANALYTIRKKELGNFINTAMKESATWDKKFTAGLSNKVQDAIDRAIEGAGGKGWSQYLNEYSTRSKAIQDTLTRHVASQKPIQPTSLPGGVNMMPSGTEHLLPNWLSKPVTGTKWLAGRYASYMEPRIDRYMADLYLHPEKMAGVLRGQAPSRYQQIAETLAQQGPYALTISNAREK